MNVNKRDQLKLPKKRKPKVVLTAQAEIYLPTFHFLSTEFQHARQHEKGIIRDDDSEFLHQYRVSLRRCLALICLLKPLFAPQQKDMLKNEIKTLMQKSNSLRDLDVFLFKMDDYFYCLEHRYHQGLTCFFDELQDERRIAYKEFKKWLKTESYEQQCLLVQGLLAELEASPCPEGHRVSLDLGKHLIWKHFSHTQELCNVLNSNSSDGAIHQLRISCKKLRYLLEYFTPIFTSKAGKEQVKALKQLQDELGDFNDSSIQQDFLGNYLKNKKVASHRYKAISQLVTEVQHQHIELKQNVIKHIELFSRPANVSSYQTLYNRET